MSLSLSNENKMSSGEDREKKELTFQSGKSIMPTHLFIINFTDTKEV